MRRTPLALAGLLLLLPMLAACSADEEQISVGQVVPARRDAQFLDAQAAVIAVPLGRIEVRAGDPTTELAANDTRQLEPITAPAGATFVPITWQYDAGTFGDYAEYLLNDSTPVVELIADGARYRLSAPDESDEGSESFYVLVQGDGADASLSVEFDGVTQTIDLATGKRRAGAAAALYDLPPRKKATSVCTDLIKEAVSQYVPPNFACRVSRAALLPYAGGTWASKGRQWLAVTLTTQMTRYDVIGTDLRSGAIYAPTKVRTTVKLGKAKPTKVIEDTKAATCPDAVQGGCWAVVHLIFDVARKHATDLRVTQSYDLSLSSTWGGGTGKEHRKAKLSGTIPVR